MTTELTNSGKKFRLNKDKHKRYTKCNISVCEDWTRVTNYLLLV